MADLSPEQMVSNYVRLRDHKAEADAAINGLNGKELMGRRIIVNEARPRGYR